MSLRAELLRITFRLIQASRILDRQVNEPPRNLKGFYSGKFSNACDVHSNDVDGHSVTTIRPTGLEGKSRHVIFLHGGAYVLETMPAHRELAEYWALNCGLRVSCIDYPLAPEYDVHFCHQVVIKAYQQLQAQYRDDTFLLFGDSAGGGVENLGSILLL